MQNFLCMWAACRLRNNHSYVWRAYTIRTCPARPREQHALPQLIFFQNPMVTCSTYSVRCKYVVRPWSVRGPYSLRALSVEMSQNAHIFSKHVRFSALTTNDATTDLSSIKRLSRRFIASRVDWDSSSDSPTQCWFLWTYPEYIHCGLVNYKWVFILRC